jgi:hypothetical protein
MANKAFVLSATASMPEIQSNGWRFSGRFLSQLFRILWLGLVGFEFHFE